MPIFNFAPDPGEQPEPYKGLGGYVINNSRQHFRDLVDGKKGAVIVSATPERGGQSKPLIRFRAFNATGDGLTVTEARNVANRAPAQTQEAPLSEFEGIVIAPGLPPVPKVVNPIPEPHVTSEKSSIIIPLSVDRPAAAAPQARRPTKSVTFIGEFSDHVFPCFDVRVDEHGWLILMSPCLEQLKLKAEQEVEITVDGETNRYWFTGIIAPMPDFDVTVRIFGRMPAESAQQ